MSKYQSSLVVYKLRGELELRNSREEAQAYILDEAPMDELAAGIVGADGGIDVADIEIVHSEVTVEKMVEISIYHLTLSTVQWARNLPGHMFYTNPNQELVLNVIELWRQPVPNDLHELLTFARVLKCYWVLLTYRGRMIGQLPHHFW